VQKRHGDAFNRLRPKATDSIDCRSLIKWTQDLAVRGHTFDDWNAPIAWNKGRLLHQVDIILIEPALRAELDRVAEPLGRQQRRACALAFDQRIRRKRRSMDDEADITRLQARAIQCSLDTLHDAPFRRVMRGEDLGCPLLAASIKHHIGERPPDIDREPGFCGLRRAHWTPLIGRRSIEAAVSAIPARSCWDGAATADASSADDPRFLQASGSLVRATREIS
jgi:hypothetical protein